MGWRRALGLAFAGCLWALPAPARADDQPAVQRAIAFLRSRAKSGLQAGETAMIALALVKAEVPQGDPALGACLRILEQRFPSSAYVPDRTGGHDVYEAAVICMAYVNADPVAYRTRIEQLAQYLVGKQKPNGSWDYDHRSHGDTSISQYAVLGLWEAENAGASVPASVWDNAAGWFMSTQHSSGAWQYHPDEATPGNAETLSMTAAGVGSLLICQRQLERYRHPTDTPNPLLETIVAEGEKKEQKYDPSHSAASINQAVSKGVAWMGRNFVADKSPVMGRSPYYGLYGFERIGALGDKKTLGGVNWYDQGSRFILGTQQQNGGWNSEFGEEVNTAYCILFLTKATAKSVRKIEIRRLGAGTLLGGRGLPSDLSSLTVAQGRVMVRPMNGAIEGMLSALEDPRAEAAESALAGLVARYQDRGPDVLRPQKDRFRKMLQDSDPGVRKVAAWALGRTGDLDVVPLLIATLKHPKEDDDVVAEARTSLQFLSRKIDGFGPPTPASAEERAQAAEKWQAWYSAIRPIDQDSQDDVPAVPASGGAKASSHPAATPAPTTSGGTR